MRMAHRQDQQANYLDFIPQRAIDHERGAAGRIVLLRPRFPSGLGARLLQPRIKKFPIAPIGTLTIKDIVVKE